MRVTLLGMPWMGAFVLTLIAVAATRTARGMATANGICSLFVALNGEDNASGSETAPFATIERALEVARGQARRTATVITLQAGVYPLNKPVRITVADAGHSYPLTLQAHGDAVLSGGVAVAGWKWNAVGEVWTVPIPKAFTDGKIVPRQLFVGGQRVPRPDIALKGPVTATTAADVAVLPVGRRRPAHPKLVGYVTTDSSVRGWTPNVVEGVFNGTAQAWTEHRCGVDRTIPINSTSTLIVMRQPCFEMAMRRSGWSQNSQTSTGVGVPHYFQNVRTALRPGQWCANTTAKTLDFKPLTASTAEDPGTRGAVAPLLESLLQIIGTSHVSVVGLGLAHSTWHVPSTATGYVSTQAGTFLTAASLLDRDDSLMWNMMPSAIFIAGSSSVVVENCRVWCVGGAGVTFSNGSANSIVRGCSFDDVSGSAVQLGGTVRNKTLLLVDSKADAQAGLMAIDNRIANSPAEYHDAVGIFVAYTSGATIAHNSLENLSYSGINLGWGWGSDAPGVGGNSVVNNSIKRYCTQLDDCGAIYTLSAQPGGLIARNYLHEAPILGCFGELPKCSNNQGVYHDAGSAFLTDRENVIDRGDCWLSLCGWDPGGCGIHNMTVKRNFIPTAEVKRLGPVCCCHGEHINGQSSVNGSSLASVVAAANIEVKSARGVVQWPTEAANIIKQAGVRGVQKG